jgi:hypothetical protein
MLRTSLKGIFTLLRPLSSSKDWALADKKRQLNMALNHIRLNFGYLLYRPANTWFELEAKATLFFYKITAGRAPTQNYKYLVCTTG